MHRSRYPNDRTHFIVGDVLATLTSTSTGPIALLRLDTDWYESTAAELHHLYPRVVTNGVVIIDDYGAWSGARKATDEYFAQASFHPLMTRVDSTRRMFVKVG